MLNKEQRDVVQAKVLEGVREGHSLSHTALDAGTNRMTIYKWRQEDSYFSQAFLEAYEEGTDCFEDVLYKNALIKEHPASVVFALRLRGRFNPLDTQVPSDMDSPSTSVEALATKALERGYVRGPERVTE